MLYRSKCRITTLQQPSTSVCIDCHQHRVSGQQEASSRIPGCCYTYHNRLTLWCSKEAVSTARYAAGRITCLLQTARTSSKHKEAVD
jgi:hypothetical protein